MSLDGQRPDHARLVVARHVAGELDGRRLAEGPGQLGALAGLYQHGVATRMTVASAHLAVIHLAMVHAFVVHAGGEHLALHGDHFLLVLGVHGLVAQVELVGQLAFVDQHEAHGLASLDLDALRFEGDVLEYHLDGAGGLGRLGRLAEGEGFAVVGKARQADQCEGGGDEQVFHG